VRGEDTSQESASGTLGDSHEHIFAYGENERIRDSAIPGAQRRYDVISVASRDQAAESRHGTQFPVTPSIAHDRTGWFWRTPSSLVKPPGIEERQHPKRESTLVFRLNREGAL